MPLHLLPLPGAQEVHLWYLHLGELGGSLQHALAGEEATPGDIHLGVRQLRFARRFYLRILLGAYLGIPGKEVEINRSVRGKPVLDKSAHDSALKFSMAKSENRLLIGISATQPLGVDLEAESRRVRKPLRLAQRYFTAAEYSALQQVAPERLDEAFMRAWACNEAVVKASGLGIANQLNRFTLQMDPDLPPAVLEIDDDDAAQWAVSLVRPGEGFIGAVAMRQPGMHMSCFRLLPPA